MESLQQNKLLDMDSVKIDPAIALQISPSFAHRRKVLPFAAIDGVAYIASLAPLSTPALKAVQRLLNLKIESEIAEPESLMRALTQVYGLPGKLGPDNRFQDAVNPLLITTNESSFDTEDMMALSHNILSAAMLRRASDIHIDPGKELLRIRFRVDGKIENFQELPMSAHSGLISRYKVLNGMDIAEKRAAQDGSFSHQFVNLNQTVDIRCATLPTKFGERMTLRLLAMHTDLLSLEKLGMSKNQLQIMEKSLEQPHGIMLLSGPTGSGKSTTLYASLRRLLAHQDLNVITIENPVEYDMDGVAQVEVDAVEKVSFAKALRSVLRHDPDVIMIGEIRDDETADVAIKASITGHLVLSTVHTNSAPTVITRLHDMGVERYLIADTLRLAVAQRLVRRLCQHCRKPRPLAESEATMLKKPDCCGRVVFEAGACKYCAGRGFVGRIGLFEILPIDADLAVKISAGMLEQQILLEMEKKKIPRMVDDALHKAFAGETSIDEILSVLLLS